MRSKAAASDPVSWKTWEAEALAAIDAWAFAVCTCEPSVEYGSSLTHSLDCELVRAMYTDEELAQIRAGQRAETRTLSRPHGR